MREFKAYDLVWLYLWTLELEASAERGQTSIEQVQFFFLGGKNHLMLDTIHLRNGWKFYDPFFLFPLSHDQSETQNLSIFSLYFAPSYSAHSWSSFLWKLPHKTCVICEGMHTTLRAQVIIFDIPSSLTSLRRHVMCFKLDQRETNSLLAAQWILILLGATAEEWLQVHFVAKDFTPLWGSVEVVYVGKVSWSRFLLVQLPPV